MTMGIAPTTAPPDDGPPDNTQPGGPASGVPERRLAEFSFAMFVTVEFGVDPGAFTCSDPDDNDKSDEITCFAYIDGGRVIVAVSPSSEGTGVYDWEVVSDHVIGAPPPTTIATTTTSTTTLAVTTPIAGPPANLSDASILSYGNEINRDAPSYIEILQTESDGAISAVTVYGWDPTTATVTLDVTLNPTMNLDQDRTAWVLMQFTKLHWQRGEPFRLQGATLRPRLVLVVSATRYVSEFDLMVRVADQLITNTDWIAAARQN